MNKIISYPFFAFVFILIISPSSWAQKKKSKIKPTHQEVSLSKLGGLEWRMIGPFRGGRAGASPGGVLGGEGGGAGGG